MVKCQQLLNLSPSDEAQSKVLSDEESEPNQRVLKRFGRISQYSPDRIAWVLVIACVFVFFGRRITGILEFLPMKLLILMEWMP